MKNVNYIRETIESFNNAVVIKTEDLNPNGYTPITKITFKGTFFSIQGIKRVLEQKVKVGDNQTYYVIIK